jgi:hypothetical protein
VSDWDDSPFEPGVLDALKAQAQWRRDKERIEASLTERERRIRAKFERAMGPDGPPELAGAYITDPTTLLVFAEAYHREGRMRAAVEMGRCADRKRPSKADLDRIKAAREPYEIAVHLMVMIWLAVRDHAEAEAMLAERRKMPSIPPVPKDWRQYRPSIYAAMGGVWVEPDNVVPLRC